jgi:hypothetical protein
MAGFLHERLCRGSCNVGDIMLRNKNGSLGGEGER